MPLQIKFHGALGEVTGSTSFLRFASAGSVYAIDCGSAHRRDVLQEPAHPQNLPSGCKPDQLRGLFLTHAHADHVGMLLYWVKAGFKGPVYCTAETARLAFFACEDSLRILNRDDAAPEVGEAEKREAQSLLENHVSLVPGEEAQVESGLTVTCHPTSHILGCVGFQFAARAKEGEPMRVFFTGDVGTVEDEAETRGMMRTRARPAKPSDYVVTEATYGDRQRKPGDRSGKARLARMAEVLERGFRHGADSKVIFPAFSLQRSQDLLLDIYQVLGFNRAATGLSAGVVPKVYLDSSLASAFMSVFRDVYRQGADGGSPWVNPSAAFFGEFADSREEGEAVLGKLLRFDRPGDCVRLCQDGEAIEVFCGPLRKHSQGPAIVLCGSGTTNNGAIQRYLYDLVEDPCATFVISGYVPGRSPGAMLLWIADQPAEIRAGATIELKEDKKRSLPKKTLQGVDIRSDCVSVADFYSGHADGPSVCRYVLGDDPEGVRPLRRVFLVHGEDGSRAGLARLMEDRLALFSLEGTRPASIECPYPESPWFDCEGDRWVEDRPVTVSLSVLVPAGDDILSLALSVFPPADIQDDPKGSLLRLRHGNASSETRLRAKAFNSTHHKLIAETTFKDVEGLLEGGHVAFRWREVLNALQLQKGEYFAGHKVCTTEAEFQEFERMRRGLVAGGKQRLHGFVVAGKAAFTPEEIAALESLLTPHVPFFVLDNQYLFRLNAALFSDPDRPRLSKHAAFYVPLKVGDPFVPIARPFGWDSLRNLLLQVGADARVKEARQPARPSSAHRAVQPLPVGGYLGTVNRLPADRAGIPREAYAALQVGDKAVVEVVAPFVNGPAKGFKLKAKATGALGVIYGVNYVGGVFDHPIGVALDAYVRTVDPDLRKVEFILSPPMMSQEAMSALAAARGEVTWRRLAKLIPCDFRRLSGLVADYCKMLIDDYGSLAPEAVMPAGMEVEVYRRIVQGLEQERIRRKSLPPPVEPFTFKKMAAILGGEWTSADVAAAARHFRGAAQKNVAAMAAEILSMSPAGGDEAEFPLERKELFYAACVEASDARWGEVPSLRSEQPARPLPAPSCYSLRDLAAYWGLSPASLLLEAEALGLDLRSDIILGTEAAGRLCRHGAAPDQSDGGG
jgi:metallo-beta-lactamase family protein